MPRAGCEEGLTVARESHGDERIFGQSVGVLRELSRWEREIFSGET